MLSGNASASLDTQIAARRKLRPVAERLPLIRTGCCFPILWLERAQAQRKGFAG